jgi:hypothetical protein
VHAPSGENSNYTIDSLYEELEHFPKYDTKLLLGYFASKLGRGNIFNPTVGNDSLHQGSNDNDVRTVLFAT